MARLCIVCFVLISCVVAGCAERRSRAATTASVASNATENGDCPVTTAEGWLPPDAPGRDALPHGPYFRSADGRLATADQSGYWHTGGMKVLWLKPAGSRLAVSGRRLGGAAPPLRADLHGPEAYPGDFEASGIHFPTAGCWEVEARAGGSVLRFVVAVR